MTEAKDKAMVTMKQRFRISQGEWVCAGCGAPMTEAGDDNGGVIMAHDKDCAQVAALRGASG
jgi:hypothetical protein